MTLRELCDKLYQGKDVRGQNIGLYTGPGKTIYPDYADEILETHGDYEVGAYQYREHADLLIVQLKDYEED